MSAQVINLAAERQRRARRREPDLFDAWAQLWGMSVFWIWSL